ncbi:MAG: permease [Bacteroidetes bacterium MedPE-SWsnd-G2]|nr:MAG: permease [Bacteroidetes bacterium MedPE-SWsnd-G2]
MFIFVLQTIWLYISELAGKDLDIVVIGKFLLYFAPKMVPLVLPLTILVASLMVFGQFSENYEFAAMKSTGISLHRAMKGLSFFIFGLAFTVFLFANNVIPWAEYKSYNLRKNIAKKKPAMAIAEGQFNELGDFNIKVESKSGDRGQYLENVVIHKKKAQKRGNYTVIVAKTGELMSSIDSDLLQLELKDGNYYDEVISNKAKKDKNKPHVKSAFSSYIINVDLAELDEVDLSEENYSNRYNMLKVSELNYKIDTLYQDQVNNYKELSQTLSNRSTVKALNNNINVLKPIDSVFKGDVLSLYRTSEKVQVLNLALNSINSTRQILDGRIKEQEISKRWLNKHIVALHEKYALALACIILFFVGAPLGAIIRKGGLGLPMIIAVLVFLIYHFIGIFAKNSATDGTLNPVLASWMSTLVMFPLSVSLTLRATKDRGLFEFDEFIRPIKRVFKFKTKSEDDEFRTSHSFFLEYHNSRLIDILKHKNEHSTEEVNYAFDILMDRGVNFHQLENVGVPLGQEIVKAEQQYYDIKAYSKFAYIFYLIGGILIILHFVFKNNKISEFIVPARDLSIIAFVVSIFYMFVMYSLSRKFYNSIKSPNLNLNFILFLIGIPFYGISHFLLKNRILGDLKKRCLQLLK